MFKRLILLLIMVVVVLGCKQHKEVVGIYKSYEPSTLKKLVSKYSFGNYVVGSTLEINLDSTFTLTNCGNIKEGIWRQNEDTLFLHCDSNRYRIDSLNQTGYNGKFLSCNPAIPTKFLLDKDKVYELPISSKRMNILKRQN